MKIADDLEFGEPVWVLRREFVVDVIDVAGTRVVRTEDGEYAEDDEDLIYVIPDPQE